MALSGPQFETVVTVVTDAFNKKSLAEIVAFKLGVDMYKAWVTETDPLRTIVFNLVEKLREEGGLAAFLDHVILARSNRPEISGPLQEIRNSMDGKTTTSGEQAAVISQGLNEVSGKIALEPVRQKMAASKGVLAQLTAKIDMLCGYKALHDSLHNAKFIFTSLKALSRQLATNPLLATDFVEAVTPMDALTVGMGVAIQKLPEDPASIRQEESDWLARFTAALAGARQAGEAMPPDHSAAMECVREILSILNTAPSGIENRLRRAAEEIDLTKLREIFTALAAVGEMAEQAAMLESGRDASEQLLRQVKAQVAQHAMWQAIDLRLAGSDTVMMTASAEEPWDFDGFWKKIKEGVAPLMALEPESLWVRKLDATVTRTDAVRAADEWNLLPKAVDDFRRQAGAQFFLVDKALNKLASEVNVIGAPLRKLLAKL